MEKERKNKKIKKKIGQKKGKGLRNPFVRICTFQDPYGPMSGSNLICYDQEVNKVKLLIRIQVRVFWTDPDLKFVRLGSCFPK